MKEITITVYNFNELSEKAKAIVLEKERFFNVEGIDWYGIELDNWKERLEELGFINPEIYFSGFGNQGDGCCFTCDYIDFEKVTNRAIYETTDVKRALYLRAIGEAWYRELVDAKITHRGHYNHDGTMHIDAGSGLEEDSPLSEFYWSFVEDGIISEARSLAKMIFEELENQYYYLISDEAVAESLIINEYDFRSNGQMFFE